MSSVDREHLRLMFDRAAELYDRARPEYPTELFDDLAHLTGIGRGSRVLEIGAGTGKATVPLAERGCHVLAIDIGPEMARVARRNLARFPHVSVVVAPFETWPLPPEPFDLVLAATAFHWIDPEVGTRKAADALRSGGAFATIATHHVAGGDRGFFIDVQACYERWDPSTPKGLRLPASDEIPLDAEDMETSGRFSLPTFRRYEWEQTYSSQEYLELLLTYSGHRALDDAARNALLDCISELIESRHGGRITKRYLTELRVAHRPG